MDAASLAKLLLQSCPSLSSVASNAVATVVITLSSRFATRLFPGREAKAEQGAMASAMASAIAGLLSEMPELSDIGIHDAFADSAVADELFKVFDPSQHPCADAFGLAVSVGGYDLSTLQQPRTPDEVFGRLVGLFRENVRHNATLRQLLTLTVAEQTHSEVQQIRQILLGGAETGVIALMPRPSAAALRKPGSPGRGGSDVATSDQKHPQPSRLTEAESTAPNVLAELQHDYEADVGRARDLLKRKRFADALVLLEQLLGRDTFARAAGATQADIWRLHGLAALRLGDLEVADRSLAAASTHGCPNPKLRLAVAELHLRMGMLKQAADDAVPLLDEPELASAARRLLAIVAAHAGDMDLSRSHLAELPDEEGAATPSTKAACEQAAGRYDGSLACMEEALRIEPDDPELLLQKAYIEIAVAFSSPGLQSGLSVVGIDARRVNLERARDALTTAVASWDAHGLRDYSVGARVQLVTILGLLGQSDQGLQVAVQATECGNADVHAWMARARCEMDCGDLVAAEESLQKAAKDDPGSAALATLLAAMVAAKGDSRAAADQIARAFSEDWEPRERVEARALQARFLWEAGAREEAVRLIESLTPSMQSTPRIIVEKADFLLRLDRVQDAQTEIETAVATYPREPAILHIAGEVNARAGNFRRALSRYAKALWLAPNPESLSGAASCCLRLRRPGIALKLIDKYERRGVAVGELSEIRARAFFAMGQLGAAAEAYEEHIRQHPGDAMSMNNAAVCWWRLGRRDRVRPLLERIAETDRQNWEVCVGLAHLHLADGKSEDAFQWVTEALSRDKDNPSVILHYFNIAFHTGHAEQAFPALKDLQDRFPHFPGMIQVPEEQGFEIYRKSLERGAKLEQLYQERKLPIAFAAERLNLALPLYRVVMSRARVPFWADSGSTAEKRHGHEATSPAQEVVIDYAALVTLAQIGMLQLAAECFRHVYVPSAVSEQIQYDRIGLNRRLNYLSARGQRRIRDQLSVAGVIDRWKTICPDLGAWPESGSLHDSFLCERACASYLVDSRVERHRPSEAMPGDIVTTAMLVEHFWSTGVIMREQRDAAIEHLRSTGNWEDDDATALGQTPERVVVDRVALSTWHDMGLLDALLERVPTVLLSPWTVYSLNQDVAEEETHREALQLIDAIESAVSGTDSGYVVMQPLSEVSEDEQAWKAGVVLAREKHLPLWSDDLVTRLIHAGEAPDSAQHFSTRSALDVALERSLVSSDAHHAAIIKLVAMGFTYCWFTGSTLAWSLHRHNYLDNGETASLLSHRGDPAAFWRVAALAIREMADRHEETREPSARQLAHWMRELSAIAGKGIAGVNAAYIALVTGLLQPKALSVRALWHAQVAIWESLGWYIRKTPGLG